MNITIKELVKKFGDAFYLLDSQQFRRNYVELKQTFSSIYPKFNIAYSYKTNYIPKICKIVNEMGGYAEVVSEMELELALKIGVNPINIIWNGPIKNPIDMEQFLLLGGVINVDSLDELEIIKSIKLKHPTVVFNLGIRVNYDVGEGVISRFGFDTLSSDFTNALTYVSNTRNVKLINIHCHFSKRQIEHWYPRVTGMIELLDKIGIIPERIDLGGGLFGKMTDTMKSQFNTAIPSYEDYASVVAKMFAERFGENGPELIIEPGTALVGDCMKFIGVVKSIKNVRGKWIASIMGSQKNINMNGINPPIEIIHDRDNTNEYVNMDLVGYTCIEGDVLYHNYSGKLAINDVIIISNCGSYSLVMKPPFILPNFPVIDISEGKMEIIKRVEKFEDIFQTYIF